MRHSTDPGRRARPAESERKRRAPGGAGDAGARASTRVARTPWWRGKASPACRKRCRTVCVHVQVFGWRARGGGIAARGRGWRGNSRHEKTFRATKTTIRATKKRFAPAHQNTRREKALKQKQRKNPKPQTREMAPKTFGAISIGPENFRGHFGWPRKLSGPFRLAPKTSGPWPRKFRGHFDFGAIGVCENLSGEIVRFVTQEKRENAFPGPNGPDRRHKNPKPTF